MNGIEKNNILNMVQPVKSKSSYFLKNNKSFEKVMKESQSLQTVQPKEVKKSLVNNTENQNDIKKLEKVIENLNSIVKDSDKNVQDDLNGLVDLLTLLQSMVQKQLESLVEGTSKQSSIESTVSESILFADSKGFMDALLNQNANEKIGHIDQMDELNGLSTILSSILSKLIETMKADTNQDQPSTIDVTVEQLKNLESALGQFLNDNGLNKEQVTNLVNHITKMISNSTINADAKGISENPVNSSIVDPEVEAASVSKIKTAETTENQSFTSSNQSFTGESIKQFALFIGKTSNKAEANQFVRDFQNIIQKSAFTNEMGQQKIYIKLFPENLGRISIELVKNEHGMTATIIASSAKAKELLQSNMDGLKQSFQLQNLQVEKIDLYQSLQAENSSYLNRDRDEKEQKQQRKQSNQSEKDEDTSSSFLDEFLKVSL